MRSVVTILTFLALSIQTVIGDDSQLKLDPPHPDPVVLVYDTLLTKSTEFCAATPQKQNLAIQVDCTGSPSCTSQYTLAGSNGATVPIALQFTDNHSSNFTLSPGVLYQSLESQGANCGNGNDTNTRTITVSVNKHDIDWTKAPFERTFLITARNMGKDRITTEEFTVLFGENGLIRISGLRDLALSKDNGWQEKNEQVCVVSSTPSYNLTATSANNGELQQNGSSINYSLQYKEHNSALWQNLTLGLPHSGITASSTELCNDGIYLGIQATVQESDLNGTPSGGYSDTVTLIVEAS